MKKNCENYQYQLLSRTIKWIRFPLILMIVMLHCYSALHVPGHPSYFVWVYPLGLWLGETGVPAFFFVSGFLFYNSSKTYMERLRSRSKTLLVPYVVWNALVLLVYGLLELSGHTMQIAGKNMADYRMFDYVRAFVDRGQWDMGNGVPMLCPYWYIRNLMVLCLVSPLLYYAIKYLRYVPLFLFFGWWMILPYNGMIASSLFFFCLGSYFSIREINPISFLREYHWYLYVGWLTLFFLDWLIHGGIMNSSLGLFVHRMALITNIFVLILIGSYLERYKKTWRKVLDDSTFWVYSVHYPLTIVVGAFGTSFFSKSHDWQILLFYCLSVLGISIICVLSYVVLHKWFPCFVSFLTGGRA